MQIVGKYLTDQAATWGEGPVFGNPRAGVITADLDGDGRLNVVACAERGSLELRWWRNLG